MIINKIGPNEKDSAPAPPLNPPMKQYTNKIKPAQFAEIEWDEGCEYGAGNEVTTSNPLLIASSTDRADQNNDYRNTNATDKDYDENNNTATQSTKQNTNTTGQNDNNSNYIGITYYFSLR